MAVPTSTPKRDSAGKVIIEALIAIFLHPIAWILSWINIFGRTDLSGAQKVVWAIVCIIWGIGPILYILLGGGHLW